VHLVVGIVGVTAALILNESKPGELVRVVRGELSPEIRGNVQSAGRSTWRRNVAPNEATVASLGVSEYILINRDKKVIMTNDRSTNDHNDHSQHPGKRRELSEADMVGRASRPPGGTQLRDQSKGSSCRRRVGGERRRRRMMIEKPRA
jgi:hypothetical protein